MAYISSQGCLIRLYNKYTFEEALALLGVTGAANAITDTVYKYSTKDGSKAQEQLQHMQESEILGKNCHKKKTPWGIYTHDQSDAKALAVAFGCKNPPDVHGPGMYAHYHDSEHAFHVWFGGQIN